MIRRSVWNAAAYATAFLGPMCFLGVLAFHFPEYLTTPQLREVYQEEQVRLLLSVGMWVSFATGIAGLLLSDRKRYAVLGVAGLILAWLAGGSEVGFQSPVQSGRFYLSLDWVLLDLTLIAVVFVSLERAFRLKPKQRVLREGLGTDLTHYVVNHLFNGGVVFVITLPALVLKDFLGVSGESLAFLPIALQVLIIMVVTDLTQYWVHRAFHEVGLLWRFHRIHHSVELMDWIAGSRLHIVDILVTRALSLTPMVLIGFSNEAVNVYLPILALQSVFVHCNLNWNLTWLRKVVSTPQFHHWHHTADPKLVDRNYSISLPVFDLLFGTYHCPRGEWPASYGLSPDERSIPVGYLRHLISPFSSSANEPRA